MTALGADPKVMWAGRDQVGGLGPSASKNGEVLEQTLALPTLQPSSGQLNVTSPSEEGAQLVWQGCSPQAGSGLCHKTYSALHHFFVLELQNGTTAGCCAECNTLCGWCRCHEGAVLTHAPVATSTPGLLPSPLGLFRGPSGAP